MTIALIPARCNPPHIGHILSFLRVKRDYEKVIVAVSNNTYNGKKDQVMTAHQAISILKEIFRHIDGFEIIYTSIPFIHRESFDDLPDFDVIVTANSTIYERMMRLGVAVKMIERTPIYRGTFIREAYKKGLEYERKNQGTT